MVLCPSAVSGIVGIKPIGLVSRSGIIPISHTQDTAGPMARTVKDAAILLGILAGIDSKDPVTNESKGKAQADYTKFLDAKHYKVKDRGGENLRAKISSCMNCKRSDLLKKQGATVLEIDYLDKINELGAAEFEVMQYEFKAGVNKYLATANAKVKH
jgi:amidase